METAFNHQFDVSVGQTCKALVQCKFLFFRRTYCDLPQAVRSEVAPRDPRHILIFILRGGICAVYLSHGAALCGMVRANLRAEGEQLGVGSECLGTLRTDKVRKLE